MAKGNAVIRACAMATMLLLSGTVAARDWRMEPGQGHLRFEGTAQGEAFQGEFKTFAPRVALEPGKPESVRIEVDVDVASADSRNKERDDALATPEFFGFDKFPKARFRTLSCRAGKSADAYDCEAELTIRDKTRKLRFPFTFKESGGQATLASRIELNRTDYDIGTGEWADAETLAHQVKVTVELKLR